MIDISDLRSIQHEANGEYPETEGIGFDIDRQIVAESTCPKCGGPQDYTQVLDHNSYRAFAVCNACKLAEEF